MRGQLQQWGYWISRMFLGVVFIYAGILKISSPQEFADSIAAYQVLPFSVINVLALGLPLFEFTCGVFVLTGFFRRIGVLGILVLLVIFILALIAALFRGLPIDCGCFGAHSWLDSNPWLALLRDGILLGLALSAYCINLSKAYPPSKVVG